MAEKSNCRLVLSAEKLVKVYGTTVKTEVLHGLDFSVRSGEFTSIIGYSGSGKSTLLNILGALDVPTDGRILFCGEDYGKMRPDELADFRNRNLGFIFQFHHLLPEFTAMENVLIPTWIAGAKGHDKANFQKRAEELLEMVGLKDFMYKKSTDLSGGQQQRVAIARALINDPTILLGDEPTGNLDTETTNQIYELFREINKNYGTTLIMVTHNDQLASRSDRIIELVDGRIHSDLSQSAEVHPSSK